jgi:hypothetical protein
MLNLQSIAFGNRQDDPLEVASEGGSGAAENDDEREKGELPQ